MRRDPIHDDEPDERMAGSEALRWWMERDLREQRQRLSTLAAYERFEMREREKQNEERKP